jgi:DNA-directed RNA polymerase specialized sigma subunit
MDQAVERDPDYVELRSRESPVRDVTLTELQKKLNEALQTLSEKHRTVVVLHDIQGIQHDEIATDAGVLGRHGALAAVLRAPGVAEAVDGVCVMKPQR